MLLIGRGTPFVESIRTTLVSKVRDEATLTTTTQADHMFEALLLPLAASDRVLSKAGFSVYKPERAASSG